VVKKKLDITTVVKRLDLILDRYEDHGPDSENEFEKIVKMYDECYNFSLKLLKKSDEILLFELPEDLGYNEGEGLEGIMETILHNAEGLRDLLYNEFKENIPTEERELKERIISIENKIKKFDERLNFCQGELDSYNQIKKDLKEMVGFHRKSKEDKPQK